MNYFVFVLFNFVYFFISILSDEFPESVSEKTRRDWSQLMKQVRKRSYIDSRMMELQAKVNLIKAMQHMSAGHGRFDFNQM